jgi:hypothetical protein
MLLNPTPRPAAKTLQLFIGATLALALSACGGGGGSPGATLGTAGDKPLPAVTMAVTNAAGAPITTLTGSETGTARASVTNNGVPAVGVVVTFTTGAQSLIAFNPGSGTALTNDKGVATITIARANINSAGAGDITGKVTIDKVDGTGVVNIAVAP